jgi:hypothetical protein
MALDQIFEAFFNITTIVLCLGVFLFIYCSRIIVETYWKNAKNNVFWTEIYLPIGPIAIGLLIALLAKKFPIPTELNGSGAGRAMYGAICGMFSSFVFNRVKAFLKLKGDQDSDLPEEHREERKEHIEELKPVEKKDN